MSEAINVRVWNAAATGAGGFSGIANIPATVQVSAYGNANGATTITLQYSADGTNFYDGPSSVLAGASDFRIDAFPGAPYCRLKSSGAITATAWISGK